MRSNFKPLRATFFIVASFAATMICSTTATAQVRVSVPLLVVAPTDVDVSPRHAGRGIHRVSRYGVYYYAPRYAQPMPGAADEWADDEDDSEFDEFESADSDNDGFISFREARRANPQWARDFRRIDTSGDGFLTREEVDAFYKR
jgi:EF hand